ncbi:hypothetical protein NC651_032913 [Populus alba x Populus x berolinensis]|nr:hypothetical protein NC651_032913 [Populus alba x Populus x berolinensis]
MNKSRYNFCNFQVTSVIKKEKQNAWKKTSAIAWIRIQVRTRPVGGGGGSLTLTSNFQVKDSKLHSTGRPTSPNSERVLSTRKEKKTR